jgi:hypothetical protein
MPEHVKSWSSGPIKASDLAVLCIPLAMYLALLFLMAFGFDLTDESFYLYHLSHPRAQAPFSVFGYLASPFGALFGHNILFYRWLALSATAAATSYYAVNAVALMREQLNVDIPVVWAVSFALVLAAFHQALMATLSYNTVMTIGTLLVVGGLFRLADGRPITETRFGVGSHVAAVALGTACALLARSISGVGLTLGIIIVVLPTARALGLLSSGRNVLWFIGSIAIGYCIAAVAIASNGTWTDLVATQTLMGTTSDGLAMYLRVYSKSFSEFGSFLGRYWLLLAFAIGIGEILRLWKFGATAFGSFLPVAICLCGFLTSWTPVPKVIASIVISVAIVALCSTVPRLLKNLVALDTRPGFNRQIAALAIIATIFVTPLLASIGTAAGLIPHVIYTLGPLGILLALPIATLEDKGKAPKGIPSAASPAIFPLMVRYAVLAGLASGVIWQREYGAYRTAVPLVELNTQVLKAPSIVRGLRVAPEVGAHLEGLAKIAGQLGFNADSARALSLYRSPGSILALELPAMGPPWTFTHIPDASFNCPLIERGNIGNWTQAVIVLHSEPRPEMLSCLQSFGLQPRSLWTAVGCAPPTTSRDKSVERNPESCVFLVRRTH